MSWQFKTYIYCINGGTSTPRWQHSTEFTCDERAIDYAKNLAIDFVGVPWFRSVQVERDGLVIARVQNITTIKLEELV